MKTSERIAELDKQRGAKIAAMQDLQAKAQTETRMFTDDEHGVFEQLKCDIGLIDRQSDSLRDTEQLIAKAAVRAGAENSGRRVNTQLERGIGIARVAQLIIASRGNDLQAAEIARSQWPEVPDLEQLFKARALGILRAATTVGTTTDPAWAGTLAYASQLSTELIELVRQEAIVGRLPGLREVPFNVRIPLEQTAIGTAAWVGEGKPKPVGKGAYTFVTIPFTKAALIVALTEELARFSTPGAEALMRNGLVRAISEFLDTWFISTNAPIPGVAPGGIRAGLPGGQSFPASGDSLAHAHFDTTHAVRLLTPTAPRSPAWLMNPTNKAYFSSLTNSFGSAAYPSVSANGSLHGYPIVDSGFVPADIIMLLDQDMILHASDPNVQLDVSREASIQLDTAPADPPTPLVSLWQQNLIGLRAEKFEYWQRARDTAVVVITGVAYGSTAPALMMAPPESPAPQTASSRGRASAS